MNTMASVVICTHNPRTDYLNRVLAALKDQTLSSEHWELMLIDNASTEPLVNRVDLTWHPNARCIVEQELGLTPARLRGIKDSRANLIVFVDDDNVLAADYLECAVQIAGSFPHIGAFGGSVKGEFEVAPEPWVSPYLHWLAIREIQRDNWSNLINSWNDSTPFGAGLCVRRAVVEDYWHKVLSDGTRRSLDRVGSGTGAAGDTDLAYCSVDLGMGIGTFCRLKLTHLIPKQRLSVDYIARLSAGIYASNPVLKSLRSSTASAFRYDLAGVRYWIKLWAKLAISSKVDRKIAMAVHAGQRSGQEFLKKSSTIEAAIQH
jgi:glycosyltransferase involved in cell wall biosynthesis